LDLDITPTSNIYAGVNKDDKRLKKLMEESKEEESIKNKMKEDSIP
jgi:hypothetical protein